MNPYPSLKSFFCTALVLAATTLTAPAQILRTDINPALQYNQAFLLAPSLSNADSEYLATNVYWGRYQGTNERLAKINVLHHAELQVLRQATMQKVPCDWGIDMNRGANTYIPFLAYAKRACIAACQEADADLQAGDESGACDDLLAALTLGRNCSQNKTLISALVQFAIESTVCVAIAENFNRFSPAALQRLSDGFDAAPARGIIGGSGPTKQFIDAVWLSQLNDIKKKYPNDNTAAMHGFYKILENTMYTTSDTNWVDLTNAAGGTIDGTIKLFQDAGPLYTRLCQIMALPHGEYENQMDQFTRSLEQTPNVLFSRDLPGWQASKRKEFSIKIDFAMLKAAIAYKLHGDAGLASVMDPCGNGPFKLKRFVFHGVDRGFQLTSTFSRGHILETYIFVEKDGPPFYVSANLVGQPLRPQVY